MTISKNKNTLPEETLFAKKLTKIMKVHNDSVRDFARRTNIPHATIYAYINGTDPSFSNIKKIADAIPGLNLNWLIRTADDIFEKSNIEKIKTMKYKIEEKDKIINMAEETISLYKKLLKD